MGLRARGTNASSFLWGELVSACCRAVSGAPEHARSAQRESVTLAFSRNMFTSHTVNSSVRMLCDGLMDGSHTHVYVPIHTGQNHWVALAFDHSRMTATYIDSLDLCTAEQAGYPEALRALLPGYTWPNVRSRVQEDGATCGLWIAWAAEVWSQSCREESQVDLRSQLRSRCMEVRRTGGIPYITDFRARLCRDHPTLRDLTHTVVSFTPTVDGTGAPENPTILSDSEDEPQPRPPPRGARFPGPKERLPGGRAALVANDRHLLLDSDSDDGGAPPALPAQPTAPKPPSPTPKGPPHDSFPSETPGTSSLRHRVPRATHIKCVDCGAFPSNCTCQNTLNARLPRTRRVSATDLVPDPIQDDGPTRLQSKRPRQTRAATTSAAAAEELFMCSSDEEDGSPAAGGKGGESTSGGETHERGAAARRETYTAPATVDATRTKDLPTPALAHPPPTHPAPHTEGEDHLTVATWNVQGLFQRTRAPPGPSGRTPHSQVADVLRDTDAHLLLCQETWVRHEHSPTTRWHPSGYRAYYSSLPAAHTRAGARRRRPEWSPQHRTTRAGVAIMVKEELQPDSAITRLLTPDPLRGYLMGLVLRRAGGEPLVVLNVYAPPSDFWSEVLEGAHAMATRALETHGGTLLLGGDWNAAAFPSDRPDGRPTVRDQEYTQWLETHALRPANGPAAGGSRRENSFASKTTRGASRIDDFVHLTTQTGAFRDALPTKVWPALRHDSDHHPVTISVPWEPVAAPPPARKARARRLVSPLTTEGREALSAALASGLETQVHSWGEEVRALTALRGEDAEGALRGAASSLEGLMRDALRVALEAVGEPESNTSLQPACSSRPQQKGHLTHAGKRTFEGAMDDLLEIRELSKALQAGGGGMEDPRVLAYTATHGLTGALDELRSHMQERAREARRLRSRELKVHDAKVRASFLAKFNHALRYDARSAHRALLSQGSHQPLRGVRTADGRLVNDREGMLKEVERYFREVSSTRIPEGEGVRREPWLAGNQQTPLDPIAYGPKRGTYWQQPPPMSASYTREVYDMCLGDMPCKKAPGPDGVYNEILKHMPEAFHAALHALFGCMWAQRKTPDTWKVALTVLLYKKGDPTLLKNHRPIGLLNATYKLWTATVTLLMTEFADARRIMSGVQEGFRAHRNTTRQLRRLMMAIEDAKVSNNSLYLLYVDFTNAFGSIDHRRMLHILETQGFPVDCLALIADLYEGASVVVRTPQGDTDPVPNGGRGTVQGDTLSPLLFILAMDPLLAWLEAGGRAYRFGTSGEKVGPLAYADDLAVAAPTLSALGKQSAKVAAYNTYMGMDANFGPNKTVWTHVARGQRVSPSALRSELRMGERTVPYLPPNRPYVYLGVPTSLALDSAPNAAALAERVKPRTQAIARAKCNPGLGLRMLETLVRPAARYSMSLGVMTLGDVSVLNSILLRGVKRVCGLPATSSTLTCYRRRHEYGLGVDPLLLTHLYATQEAITDLLNSREDLGLMFRGLLSHHAGHIARDGFSGLPCASTRGYPVLRMAAQAARLGVGWTDAEGALAITPAGEGGGVVSGSILEAVLAAGVGQWQVGFLQPLWEAGLHDMDQLLNMSGTRLLTAPDLVRSGTLTRMSPPQHRALRRLATVLETDAGRLPVGFRRGPREGELQNAWRGTTRYSVPTLDDRLTAAQRERDEHRDASPDHSDGEEGTARPKPRKRQRARFGRMRGYRTGLENRRRVVVDTDEGHRRHEYQMILGKRSVREYEQVRGRVGKKGRMAWVLRPRPGDAQPQWLVQWIGRDPGGDTCVPTWEPKESFDVEDDPDAILSATRATMAQGLTPLQVTDTCLPLAGRRVNARVLDGSGPDAFRTGTLYANPRKRRLPYVVRYDDVEESDEETNMLFDEEVPPIILLPTAADVARCGPGTPPDPARDSLRAALVTKRLVLGTKPVTPGQDVVASGRWRLVRDTPADGASSDVIRLYSPEGSLVGTLGRGRLHRLHLEYHRYTCAPSPPGRDSLAPMGFLPELGALFRRYATGRDRGDGSKVNMNNHWGTPTRLREEIRTRYAATDEMFASPLNFNLEFERYCSAHPRDVLFGAVGNAYEFAWGRQSGPPRAGHSLYMNPEYALRELRKALEWAIAASERPAPFSAVGVFPRWHSAPYMNLLGHPNVLRVATFERNTFAFVLPDGVGDGGGRAAEWPVMVLEVSNAGGRRAYRKPGYREGIERAGMDVGAVVFDGVDHAFDTWGEKVSLQHKAPRDFLEARPAPYHSARGPAVGLPLPDPVEERVALAYVNDGLQLYTDGSKIRGEVGAGVYDALSGKGLTMKVQGPQTVNRAELVAILAALRYAGNGDAVIYTDSLVALLKLRNWILRPGRGRGDKHADVVGEICSLIATRRATGRTQILKVPAHTGLAGNEEADRLAKKAALDPWHLEHNPLVGPEAPAPPRFVLRLARPREGSLKQQLREGVVEWLTKTHELGQVFHDIWKGPLVDSLDTDPSTWMWRRGGDIPRAQLIHVLRMRTGEFVCNYWLHKRGLTDQGPACPLCAWHMDRWGHTAGGHCGFEQVHPVTGLTHKPLGGLATARHNAACRVVASAMVHGTKGKHLTLHSFGRENGEREQQSVPDWMLQTLTGVGRLAYKPDYLMLEGWPATAPPPSQVVKSRGGVTVRVVLADLTFTMDCDSEDWEAARREKQVKYTPLLHAMRAAGWLVNPTVQVITVGHRATLPLSNKNPMLELGVRSGDIQELQRALHVVAAKYLASLVRLTRVLRSRRVMRRPAQGG